METKVPLHMSEAIPTPPGHPRPPTTPRFSRVRTRMHQEFMTTRSTTSTPDTLQCSRSPEITRISIREGSMEIRLEKSTDTYPIVTMFQNHNSAAHSDISAGDLLIELNGESTERVPLTQIRQDIAAGIASGVQLTLARLNDETPDGDSKHIILNTNGKEFSVMVRNITIQHPDGHQLSGTTNLYSAFAHAWKSRISSESSVAKRNRDDMCAFDFATDGDCQVTSKLIQVRNALAVAERKVLDLEQNGAALQMKLVSMEAERDALRNRLALTERERREDRALHASALTAERSAMAAEHAALAEAWEEREDTSSLRIEALEQSNRTMQARLEDQIRHILDLQATAAATAAAREAEILQARQQIEKQQKLQSMEKVTMVEADSACSQAAVSTGIGNVSHTLYGMNSVLEAAGSASIQNYEVTKILLELCEELVEAVHDALLMSKTKTCDSRYLTNAGNSHDTHEATASCSNANWRRVILIRSVRPSLCAWHGVVIGRVRMRRLCLCVKGAWQRGLRRAVWDQLVSAGQAQRSNRLELQLSFCIARWENNCLLSAVWMAWRCTRDHRAAVLKRRNQALLKSIRNFLDRWAIVTSNAAEIAGKSASWALNGALARAVRQWRCAALVAAVRGCSTSSVNEEESSPDLQDQGRLTDAFSMQVCDRNDPTDALLSTCQFFVGNEGTVSDSRVIDDVVSNYSSDQRTSSLPEAAKAQNVSERDSSPGGNAEDESFGAHNNSGGWRWNNLDKADPAPVCGDNRSYINEDDANPRCDSCEPSLSAGGSQVGARASGSGGPNSDCSGDDRGGCSSSSSHSRSDSQWEGEPGSGDVTWVASIVQEMASLRDEMARLAARHSAAVPKSHGQVLARGVN